MPLTDSQTTFVIGAMTPQGLQKALQTELAKIPYPVRIVHLGMFGTCVSALVVVEKV